MSARKGQWAGEGHRRWPAVSLRPAAGGRIGPSRRWWLCGWRRSSAASPLTWTDSPGPCGAWAQDLTIAPVLPDPRAERRRRLAEPDLEFRPSAPDWPPVSSTATGAGLGCMASRAIPARRDRPTAGLHRQPVPAMLTTPPACPCARVPAFRKRDAAAVLMARLLQALRLTPRCSTVAGHRAGSATGSPSGSDCTLRTTAIETLAAGYGTRVTPCVNSQMYGVGRSTTCTPLSVRNTTCLRKT